MKNYLSDYDYVKDVLLVTHSGQPHADETGVTSLLEQYFEVLGKNTSVLRTRDSNVELPENSIVYDVFLGRFDHHQGDIRDGGRVLSSFGKIWRWGKEEFKRVFKLDNISWQSIDENFIRYIDHSDNTGELNPYTYIMVSLRNSSENEEEAWNNCLSFAKTSVKAILEEERQLTKFRSTLKKLKVISVNNRLLKISEKAFPINSNGFYPDADGIVMKSRTGTYKVRMLNHTPLKKQDIRNVIPGIISLKNDEAEITDLSVLKDVI